MSEKKATTKEALSRYRVSKTMERFSFDGPGSTSSFWTWLLFAWNVLDANEADDKVHHTGVRIAGCRYDSWKVTPKPATQKHATELQVMSAQIEQDAQKLAAAFKGEIPPGSGAYLAKLFFAMKR